MLLSMEAALAGRDENNLPLALVRELGEQRSCVTSLHLCERDISAEKALAFRLISIAYWPGAYVMAPLHKCLTCVACPSAPAS